MQWLFTLPAWEQSLFAAFLLVSATTLGAALVFFSKRFNRTLLTVLTALSAGIMIAASFFSLLLPALSYETALPSFFTVTLAFFLGGGFLILADFLLSRKKSALFGLDRRSGLMFLAVTLHNVPEGMAAGVAFAAAPVSLSAALSALIFTVGIAVQNFPEGASVAFPLKERGLSARKSFLLSAASGAVEVPACFIGTLAATFIKGLLPWALAFSAGAMIAVVCSELIPECFSGNKTVASLGILFGFCLMMVLDLALG